MQEHRQYIRINKSLIVSYRIINQFIGSGGRSKNISAGGICLPLFQRLEPGVILELEIFLLEDAKPIKTIGEVMWSTKRDDIQFPFEVGIKFIKIEPSDRDKIFDYITEESKKDVSIETRWLG